MLQALLLRLLELQAAAQRANAEGQVPRQFLQQRDFAGCESPGFRRIDGEGAKGSAVLILERQGNIGQVAAPERFFPPGRGLRIGLEVLSASRSPTADGAARGAAPVPVLRPAYEGCGEVAIFGAGPGGGAHGLGLIVFRIACPGHAIAGPLANDAAYFRKQGLLAGSAQQRLIAVGYGPEFAI